MPCEQLFWCGSVNLNSFAFFPCAQLGLMNEMKIKIWDILLYPMVVSHYTYYDEYLDLD